ncbi:MAG: cbb3-type cytochrome oxidase assembly protein CcoS [Myxococcota bacterium]|nr:cbb3-type cytochrome oxidase assembly protein CcoS [Myxococcota bacterium]
MSFLAVTIPVSLLLAAVLLALVVRAARRGDFDDWEGPAMRHLFDDDRTPECEESGAPSEGATGPGHPDAGPRPGASG